MNFFVEMVVGLEFLLSSHINGHHPYSRLCLKDIVYIKCFIQNSGFIFTKNLPDFY